MSDIPYEKFAKITDEHGQQFCQVKYELRVAMVSEVMLLPLLPCYIVLKCTII